MNSTPNVHTICEPTIDDHSMYSPGNNFRIPLLLWGIFSYLLTSKPMAKIMGECHKVVLLTPEGKWNPHSDVYALNEEVMVD